MNKQAMKYYRPATQAELSKLLVEIDGKPLFLARGNYYEKALDSESMLIDLQEVGFEGVEVQGDQVHVGSLSNLASIGHAFESLPDLQEALSMETGINVRNSISLLNFVNSADGRSPFLSVLSALQPRVSVFTDESTLSFKDYLAQRKEGETVLFSEMRFARPKAIAFEAVARTPKDRPIVCLALAELETGSVSAACGGLWKAPKLLTLNGNYEVAAHMVQQTYQNSSDQWASGTYRQEMAEVLLSRCLQKLGLAALRKEAK